MLHNKILLQKKNFHVGYKICKTFYGPLAKILVLKQVLKLYAPPCRNELEVRWYFKWFLYQVRAGARICRCLINYAHSCFLKAHVCGSAKWLWALWTGGRASLIGLVVRSPKVIKEVRQDQAKRKLSRKTVRRPMRKWNAQLEKLHTMNLSLLVSASQHR